MAYRFFLSYGLWLMASFSLMASRLWLPARALAFPAPGRASAVGSLRSKSRAATPSRQPSALPQPCLWSVVGEGIAETECGGLLQPGRPSASRQPSLWSVVAEGIASRRRAPSLPRPIHTYITYIAYITYTPHLSTPTTPINTYTTYTNSTPHL